MIETITYNKLLLLEPWRRKREVILRRDKNKCRNCGSAKQLQIHHRQYHVHPVTGDKRDPWDYDNRFLVTLCETCHASGHKQYSIRTFKR
jgi:5-methylcytosine-specific restriction endonuclease McrA